MDESAAALLLQMFGQNFLAYVTAAAPEVIHRRLSEDVPLLTDDQEAVLRELAEAAPNLATQIEPPELLQMRLVEVFGSFVPVANMTFVNVLRRQAGGGLWESNETDPVVHHLLTLVRDFYPLLLLPGGSGPFETPSQWLSGPLWDIQNVLISNKQCRTTKPSLGCSRSVTNQQAGRGM